MTAAAQIYPGLDGIPFRLHPGQQVPFLKQNEIDSPRLSEVREGRACIFDLSCDNQLSDYNDIIDRAAKGTVLLSREEVNWDAERRTYVAFVRWIELYLESPVEGKCDADGNRILK